MQFTFHINKIYVCNAVCTDIKLNWTFARNGVLLNMEVNYRLEFDIFISTDCEMKLCVCVNMNSLKIMLVFQFEKKDISHSYRMFVFFLVRILQSMYERY